MNNNQCVIYARCASSVQEDNHNLETQIQELKEYANKKGYKVAKTYKEIGSGMTRDRSVLNQLIEEVEQKNVKLVLCRSFDRISRNFIDWMLIQQQFEEKGVKVITLQEPNSECLFINNFLVLCEEYYQRKLEKQLREGKLRKSN